MSDLHHGLPPNQRLAAPGKWPLVGERDPGPGAPPDAAWTISISGLVRAPANLTLTSLRAMPQETRVIDVHCVTRWSRPQMRFRGVPLRHLLDLHPPAADAQFLSFTAYSAHNHATSLPLALTDDILIALEADDAPLTAEHGGPVRTVTRGRYFYKSLKWLKKIDLLAEDRLGTWERESGYHNEADPWREQRYMTPDLDRLEVARVLKARDFSNRSLRSLVAARLDLEDLVATGALLRDADFTAARLARADFSQANLSNARFTGADLRDARFTGADLEGADFSRADLRGADLRGASLFGTTFGPANAPDSSPAATDQRAACALTDNRTTFPRAALDVLTPADLKILGRVRFE